MFKKIGISILCLLLLLATGCKEENIDENLSTNKISGEEASIENSEYTDKLKVLRLASSSDIHGLDTSLATDRVSFEVLGNTMEGLFVLTGGNELKNGVCERFTIRDDGKKYTFKLRQDSVWSNGDPVTAHDFVYAWRRLGDSVTGGQYSFMLEIAGIKNSTSVIKGETPKEELGVYAKDDYTLVVELEQPIPYLPNVLSFPSFLPLNKDFVEGNGKKFGKSVESTLYNGPYVLHEWEVENYFVYKKNENYWNKDSIKIDQINVTITKDRESMIDMYRAGIIDYTDISSDQISRYSDFESLALRSNFSKDYLITVPSNTVFYLELLQQEELLQNRNLRKALALSINKEIITTEILNNGSIPVDYLIPTSFALGPDGKDFRDSTEIYNHYNPDEAKKYWEEAKKELGIETATLVFLTYDSETTEAISNSIVHQLESNLQGLSIEIGYQMFGGKYAGEVRMGKEIIDGDDVEESMQFAGWGPDYLDPMTFLDMWTTDSRHNLIGYSNDEYDSIIEKTNSSELALDLETRWSELQRAEKILLDEDVALIPLYQRGGIALIKSYVKNWRINSFAPERYWGTMDILE